MPTDALRPRLFRNGRLSDGSISDLAVRNGRFVETQSLGDAFDMVDLGGLLILPPFVDGHIHLDKSFVGDRWRPCPPSAPMAQIEVVI